jgi:hypothetical protein
MKAQGATKQILSTRVHKDGNNGKLWLKFNMNIKKLVNILIAFHYKFSSILSLLCNEEKVMSRIPCVSSVGILLDGMK